MRSPIHVLIVDDSALIRQMLARALALDSRIEVVGVARNGVEAIEKAKTLNPDVITLDIEMPELNGLEVLKELPRHSSARVVVLSSLDDPETTYQALSLGAVDFIPKPKAGMATSIDSVSDLLCKVIRIANRAKPVQLQQGVFAPSVESEVDASPSRPESTAPTRPGGAVQSLVAIASSTGGPPALERVLAGLDASKSVAYVIVQHLPDGFHPSFAMRLSAVGALPVVIAEDGMLVEPGMAYLAPWGSHTLVERDGSHVRLRLTRSVPQLHGVRPAADPLFESVAEVFGDSAVGVVLTGMGRDAADGMLAIKKAGGATVAQDEETSVVWGMPGAAVRRKAVRRVVPLGLIAVEIRRSLRERV